MYGRYLTSLKIMTPNIRRTLGVDFPFASRSVCRVRVRLFSLVRAGPYCYRTVPVHQQRASSDDKE